MSELTTISSKGQVTVPRDVRERLGLQAGDKIAWSMLSNGTTVLLPKARRLADLVGILTQPGQPGVSADEMRLPECASASTRTSLFEFSSKIRRRLTGC